jgi:hypothetical protein
MLFISMISEDGIRAISLQLDRTSYYRMISGRMLLGLHARIQLAIFLHTLLTIRTVDILTIQFILLQYKWRYGRSSEKVPTGVMMKISSKPGLILSAILYMIGLFVGISFLGLYVWANIEASLFDPALSGDESLRALQCPMIITEEEIAVIRVSLNNPLDRDINRLVRLRISEGMVTLKRQVDQRAELTPGESVTLEWEAYPEDAAFDRIILVRGYIFRHTPLPARSGSCGIIVVNFPFLTGNQIGLFAALGSFLTMGIGSLVWITSTRPVLGGKQRHLAVGMVWLFFFLMVGIVLSYFGLWQMAFLLLFIITVLSLGIITYLLLGY